MIHRARVPRWQVPALDTLTGPDRLEQTTLRFPRYPSLDRD